MQAYYLGEIEPAIWQKVFVFCLHHGDSFTVRFSNKEGVESPGFKKFFALPNVKITKWLGDKEGLQFEGPLTEEAKEAFYKLQEPAFSGGRPDLWEGKLFQKGREILSIEDFTSRMLYLMDQEVALLIRQGVDVSNWEGVSMTLVDGTESETMDWDEEELRIIAGLISHWLSSDKKH